MTDLTTGSRYYLKNNQSTETLVPDELTGELMRESQVHFLHLNAVEVAVQLTLQDFAIFTQIESTEYVDDLFQLHSKYGTPHLTQFSEVTSLSFSLSYPSNRSVSCSLGSSDWFPCSWWTARCSGWWRRSARSRISCGGCEPSNNSSKSPASAKSARTSTRCSTSYRGWATAPCLVSSRRGRSCPASTSDSSRTCRISWIHPATCPNTAISSPAKPFNLPWSVPFHCRLSLCHCWLDPIGSVGSLLFSFLFFFFSGINIRWLWGCRFRSSRWWRRTWRSSTWATTRASTVSSTSRSCAWSPRRCDPCRTCARRPTTCSPCSSWAVSLRQPPWWPWISWRPDREWPVALPTITVTTTCRRRRPPRSSVARSRRPCLRPRRCSKRPRWSAVSKPTSPTWRFLHASESFWYIYMIECTE